MASITTTPPSHLNGRVGGPLGRAAKRVGIWFTAGPWAVLLATITWLILMARQVPCRQSDVFHSINNYYRMCYSDIPILYRARNLGEGVTVYNMEYPLLTQVMVDWSRRVTHLLGGRVGPGITGQEALDAANIFYGVNAVALFAFFVVTVIAQVRSVPHRPFDAIMVAGAPVVAAAGLINWDMLCIALTAVGVWAWSRKMPMVAGLLWGLGVAAKLYPLLIFVPLAVLCLRSQRLKAYFLSLGAAIASWAAVNVPAMLMFWEDWLHFWEFNRERGIDLGSVLMQINQFIPITDVSKVTAVLDMVGALVIGVLIVMAPRRPRFGQVVFLMVVWFLIVNKVYSPQYVLWILPFLVLARPVWRDWIIWTVGELIYFATIWGYLAQTLTGPGRSNEQLYFAAIIVRILAQLWVAAMVIRDMFAPQHDVVRRGGHDDPTGGVLDEAPDAVWLDRLVGRRPHSEAAQPA